MPAKSQAQRGFLAVHFGPAWMRLHHFDNPGKLPQYVGKKSYEEGGQVVRPNPAPNPAPFAIPQESFQDGGEVMVRSYERRRRGAGAGGGGGGFGATPVPVGRPVNINAHEGEVVMNQGAVRNIGLPRLMAENRRGLRRMRAPGQGYEPPIGYPRERGFQRERGFPERSFADGGPIYATNDPWAGYGSDVLGALISQIYPGALGGPVADYPAPTDYAPPAALPGYAEGAQVEINPRIGGSTPSIGPVGIPAASMGSVGTTAPAGGGFSFNPASLQTQSIPIWGSGVPSGIAPFTQSIPNWLPKALMFSGPLTFGIGPLAGLAINALKLGGAASNKGVGSQGGAIPGSSTFTLNPASLQAPEIPIWNQGVPAAPAEPGPVASQIAAAAAPAVGLAPGTPVGRLGGMNFAAGAGTGSAFPTAIGALGGLGGAAALGPDAIFGATYGGAPGFLGGAASAFGGGSPPNVMRYL